MQALILAGGSGTRFWPLSRRLRPKQLLALDGGRSLLQATVDRLAPSIPPENVWVCTTAHLADAVREQLPAVPAEQILAEPEGRNTAPAIGWSLACMPESARDDVVAVLPSDHRFADAASFRRTLDQAARAAVEHDLVMTLGVAPRWAETGYGYLELGEALGQGEGSSQGDEPAVRQVAQFREKPDEETARAYVESGNFLWNAGIFVFEGSTLLRHLRRFEPEMGEALDAIATDPARTSELYPTLRSISIDYAVMERLESIGTLPLDCGWNDLGSWKALNDELARDADGNASQGDVMALDSRNNLLYADEGQVAVLGVEGLVVVRTGDTVLVAPVERSQDVRQIVDRLKAENRTELL